MVLANFLQTLMMGTLFAFAILLGSYIVAVLWERFIDKMIEIGGEQYFGEKV